MLRLGGAVVTAILSIGSVAPLGAAPTGSTPDSGFVLEGGTEGTSLGSLTIEGEDRIQFDFERPTLRIDIDPTDVPGLELGSALHVLDRSRPDLLPPLLSASAAERSPYVARPWLSNFASGAVARFRPQLEDVERWTLTIADSRGQTVATFRGKDDPPEEIAWDGTTASGEPVVPGLTYSYVLEAFDRAGNKRNFVGESFQIPAYRMGTGADVMLVLNGSDLQGADGASGMQAYPMAAHTGAPPVLLEAASWMNQSSATTAPVRITVTARSYDQASRLAETVAVIMRASVIGDPARIQTTTDVRPDAPAAATLQISRSRSGAPVGARPDPN